MKDLKLLLLLGFFISSLSVYAQTDCFPENDQVLCTEIIKNLVDIVEHPDYPGCPLTVEYDLRVCQGEFQIANLSILEIPFGSEECGPLVSDILGAFFSGDQLRLERVLTNLWSGTEEALADLLFAEALAGGPLALFYCGTGLQTFTAGFYRGSCVSTCVSVNQKGGIRFVPVSCGTTCCVLKREYCIDPVTGEEVIAESVEQVNPGECFLFERPECPEGSFFQSPCFELCEND